MPRSHGLPVIRRSTAILFLHEQGVHQSLSSELHYKLIRYELFVLNALNATVPRHDSHNRAGTVMGLIIKRPTFASTNDVANLVASTEGIVSLKTVCILLLVAEGGINFVVIFSNGRVKTFGCGV